MATSGGLRERKKVRTRREIRREALRLFGSQGYEQTTIEQIAEAAEVSVSTFFRYFGTKEDVVLPGDNAPLFKTAFESRPLDEPFIEAARQALTGVMTVIIEEDHTEILVRAQLVARIPELQARYWQQQRNWLNYLVEQLRVRSAERYTEFELRVTAAALIGAITEAKLLWAEHDGVDSLVELVDRALQQVGGFLRI